MQWTVETLNHLVDAEIEALPPLLNARLIRLMEMVQNIGLERMCEPHVKHIEGKIWELRAKASEGIARAFYVTITGRRVIILHVFVKKSDKTPRGALETARNRMKEVKP
jgi:phage-related protein